MANMHIREATIGDARDLYSIHAAVWLENEVTYGISSSDILSYILEPIEGEIARAEKIMAPDNYCVVAQYGSRIVGFFSTTIGEDGHRLDSAYVDLGHRSAGAGAGMMNATKEHLGDKNIFVDTHVANSRGKKFYREHGFRPTGLLKDTVESGALVFASGAIFPQMELKLEAS